MENKTASVSLRMISEAAGVSRMTVSLALRNHPSLPAATRTRIQKLAGQMGYCANPELSKLMTAVRRSRNPERQEVLAFLNSLPPQEAQFSPYPRAVLTGAVQRAQTIGYRVEVVHLNEPGMTGRRASTLLTARGVRGVLIGPLRFGIGHLSLRWADFSAVAVTHSLARPRLHRVCPNHVQGMTLVLQQLRRLRYRRVGLVLNTNTDRRVGFNWKAMFLIYQQSVPASQRIPPLIPPGGDIPLPALQAWYQRHKPDVIVSTANEYFVHISQLGVRIPEQLGFVALDYCKTDCDLATLDQNYTAIGAAGVDLLTGLLHRNERGIPAVTQTVQLDGIWRPGRTLRQT